MYVQTVEESAKTVEDFAIGSKAYCSRDITILQAAERIAELDVNALAVVEGDGSIAGIVTDHDIIRVIVKSGGQLHDTTVEGCMSVPAITCEESVKLSDTLKLMGKHRIRHLVVVRNDAFVRVLTIKELLERLHRDDGLEANVLREMAFGKLVEAS